MKIRISFLIARAAVCIALLSAVVVAVAQVPTRFVGTITAISGNTLTVKTDADGAHQVNVPSTAVLKRIAPGQKDLTTAETIPFSDLAIGDRALVKLDPTPLPGLKRHYRLSPSSRPTWPKAAERPRRLAATRSGDW